MKIALIGYGNMGQMIEKIALSQGHEIVARMTSVEWDLGRLESADVCMEFTHPESVLQNVQKVAQLKKDVIIGTTGWHEKMSTMRAIVEEGQIGALYSANFSIGIHLFLEILKYSAQLLDQFTEYSVAGVEYHHSKKKDSPSGTALEIARSIKENMERVDEVPFSSIRCGSIPGTHTLLFDSPSDTIVISHEARNREGFAMGAVQAAEWLRGRKGLYTFHDCVGLQ